MRKLLLSAASVGLIAAPAVAEISDGTVKIGILNDQSGVYSDFGGKNSYEAALMAVEDFGGKVLDAPIEVVTADHQNKADIASNIARQWYDTEQVDSIMELTTSSVALAVQALSTEKQKITMTTGAATTEQGRPCVFVYGTITLCGVNFHSLRLTHDFVTSRPAGRRIKTGPTTLERQRLPSWHLLNVNSPFKKLKERK
jgi:branched-chain amino acid transport system substrate-binding protein